jgi:hypothetical protein
VGSLCLSGILMLAVGLHNSELLHVDAASES